MVRLQQWQAESEGFCKAFSRITEAAALADMHGSDVFQECCGQDKTPGSAWQSQAG